MKNGCLLSLMSFTSKHPLLSEERSSAIGEPCAETFHIQMYRLCPKYVISICGRPLNLELNSSALLDFSILKGSTLTNKGAEYRRLWRHLCCSSALSAVQLWSVFKLALHALVCK